MKKLLLIVICVLLYLQIPAQEGKQRKTNQLKSKIHKNTNNSKKMTLFNLKALKQPKPSNFIGSGNFNPFYPNFYTFCNNKYWPMDIINIQYEPQTNSNTPNNNKHMTLEVTAKTQIPGQDIINTGPPIYETSDLKFYENLFRNSKDYIIIFNINGQNNLMYYHKSLMPNFFKPKN